jgi:hypothetical protein
MHQYEFQIPDVINCIDIEKEGIKSVNAGILGGNNIDFIQQYCKEAFAFFEQSAALFSTSYAGKLNVVVEQLLFYRLAIKSNQNIHFLLNSVAEEFSDLMQFNLIPNYQKYIHLVGFAKKSPYACDMVDRHLQYEFPDFHQNILQIFHSINTMSSNV